MLTLERRRAAASPALIGTVRVSTGECAAEFPGRLPYQDRRQRFCPPASPWSCCFIRRTSCGARPIWRCATGRPRSGNYYVAKLGTFAVAVYRHHGEDADAWVAYTNEQSQGRTHDPARWGSTDKSSGRRAPWRCAPSLLMHAEAIRAGTGRGVLPCYVGDARPVLERLTAPIPQLAATYWIIVHHDPARLAYAQRSTGYDRPSPSSAT